MPHYSSSLHPYRPLRRQAWIAYLATRSLVQCELTEALFVRWYSLTSTLADRWVSTETKQRTAQIKQAIVADECDTLAAMLHPPLDRAIDSNRNTPLHVAILYDRADIARWLILQGARPNVRNLVHYTPLHEAVVRGSLDLIRLLIEAGADVNTRAVDGETPLSLACAGAIALDRHGQVASRPSREVVQLLIDSGARVNARGHDGLTPLHEAACPGQPDAIALLLAWGADINARDATLQTPLHHAVAGLAVEAARLLVARGADLCARDMVGCTPLERARRLAPPRSRYAERHYRELCQVLQNGYP